VVVGDVVMGRTPVDVPLRAFEGSLTVFDDDGGHLGVELLTVSGLDERPAAPAHSAAASGKVTLHSQEMRGARVTIDGEYRGVLPLSLTLTEGPHQFALEPVDGEAYTMERTIAFDVPGMGVTLMIP
jgi:hypothetical protein